MLKRINTRMKKSTALRIAVLILGCASLGALFILGIFSNFGYLLARSTPFPINMHSSVQANYQKDPDYMQIPPMDIQLVVDAVWDQNLNSQNLSLRLTQVNDNFLASVASVTPRPTATITGVSEFTPTITQGGPTATIDLTPSSAPTATPIGFIASPTATDTAETPVITDQSPTDTPPTPANTAVPPTNTSPPPTNTVSPCVQLSLSSYNTSVKKVAWLVVNDSPAAVYLDRLSLTWPSSNDDLTKTFFGQSKIWEGSTSPPSITINPTGQVLPGNSSKKIEFFFTSQAASSGYNMTLNLSGCVLSTSN